MNQPKFTWWPWRFLALIAPLLALGGAALAASERHPRNEVFGIFFSVLAAANGYLFAMAVGDFGRSIIAIPVGAAAGYAAVFFFSFALPNVIFVVFLFIVVGLSLASRMMKALPGCLMMAFLFFAFMAFFGALFNHRSSRSEAEMCVFCSYPFVCGCVAAAMPIENTLLAIYQAGLAGIRAAMYGMAVGGAISAVIAFCGALLLSAGISRRTEAALAMIFFSGSVALINYFCIQNIFTAVHRAEGESISEPPPANTDVLTPLPEEENAKPDSKLNGIETNASER